VKSLLQKTFENEFNDSNYRDLILNLFNSFNFSKEHSLKHQFNDAERQALNDFTYFGTYEDAEKKSLDVLTVQLKSSSKVERARSLQRNLIGKYLKTNLKDSALVAFYSKDNPDWRLSFVKMDYRLDEKGVKVEIGTPPKRYSFLVGKTEPSHTAQKQLMPLLDDRKVPILDEIEKSFSIEKVTKEFYTEIAKKFTELVGGERKIGSKKIVEAGQLKYPKPSDTLRKEFAVRLIGRLMFCWFLKKKKSEGGVPLIPNVLLSSDAISQYIDYYHSLLEPLFFQVLNTPVEKRNRSVRHSFWNNVPFLNGGLFEPHLYDYYEIYYESGLSKYINTLKIPDSWFLDLFKIFEIYNFTIDESTSIDIDISVDPEMLGRIFENLLAEINPQTGETARKSTGSYYTPRPIVEYMVDESLKQYLLTQTAPSLHPSHQGREIPSPLAGEGKGEGESFNDKLSKLLSYGDWEIDLIETEKDAIIDALDRVKIIDPACGSGAFPMGILHKMLLILQKIDPESKQWLSKKLARIDNEILRKELEKNLKTENWDYIHKLGIIQNSIYGVDIQPIAVEISKLRFFLSLIVDERIDDDKPNRGVVPLPNLEFKFVAANSLIGLPLTSSLSQMELFEARDYINRLKELRDAYFTSYGEEKNKIEQEFQRIQNKMFEYAHKEMVTHKKTLETQTLKLSEWNPFADEASSWFDPEWMFGVKDGFDIVLGNPPYMGFHGIDKQFKRQLQKIYVSADGKFDLYIPFIERSYTLMPENGYFVFICPTAFTKRDHGEKLRQFLRKNVCIKGLVDFEHDQMFEGAVNYTGIFSFIKTLPTDNCAFTCRAGFDNSGILIEQSNLTDVPWIFSASADAALVVKIKSFSMKLHEITKISEGVVTGLNDLYLLNRNIIKSNGFETRYFVPCNRGKEIDRYHVQNSKELLFYPYIKSKNKTVPVDEQELKTECPQYYKHLRNNIDKINSRPYFLKSKKKWYELWNQRDLDNFSRIKIITPELSERNRFALADKKVFYGDTVCGIVISNEYLHGLDYKFLLAVLNSRLIEWYYKKSTVPKAGGFFIYKVMFLKNVPIKIPPLESQQRMITLVDQILSLKQTDPNADITTLECQIDKLVYELYDLTPEEIEIVEGKG
jgi:hypothetical protein